MATDTLYYLCQSEDASSGLFGTAKACAHWYLTYGGADYRIYRKFDERSSSMDNTAVSSVGKDGVPVWHVAFKPADTSKYRESLMTVTGKDEAEADQALKSRIVETRLLSHIDADENFYMIRAEQALPILMWAAEMREIYDLAGEPPTDNEKEVKKWFWNTEHGKQALSRMVDFLASRHRNALPPLQAEQIKAQIDALIVAPDMPIQHKASTTHYHPYAGNTPS